MSLGQSSLLSHRWCSGMQWPSLHIHSCALHLLWFLCIGLWWQPNSSLSSYGQSIRRSQRWRCGIQSPLLHLHSSCEHSRSLVSSSKCVSLCCVYAEFLRLSWRLARASQAARQLLILTYQFEIEFATLSISSTFIILADAFNVFIGSWSIPMTYRNYARRIHLDILEFRYRWRTMGHIFYPKCTYIDPQRIDLTAMVLAALIK